MFLKKVEDTKGITRSCKSKKGIINYRLSNTNQTKNCDELVCSGISCSTIDTCCVNVTIDKKPLKIYEWVNEGIGIMTNSTNSWSKYFELINQVMVVIVTFLKLCLTTTYSWFSYFLINSIPLSQMGRWWLNELDYLTTHTSLAPIRRGCALGFANHKKGALDSQ